MPRLPRCLLLGKPDGAAAAAGRMLRVHEASTGRDAACCCRWTGMYPADMSTTSLWQPGRDRGMASAGEDVERLWNTDSAAPRAAAGRRRPAVLVAPSVGDSAFAPPPGLAAALVLATCGYTATVLVTG